MVTDRGNRLWTPWGSRASGAEDDWVLEFDIRGLFDNLPHDLFVKPVRKHVNGGWALLYIERWLTAPMTKDGMTIERTRVRQGGVISPIFRIFLALCFRSLDGEDPP